ncbi:MAG: TetR family transcriptional regulator [Actinomycetota bacterium]
MSDPRVDAAADEAPRAADGRVAGRRGQATRQRLLAATRAAVADGPYRDLKVVEISRRADTSPATFYQYFPDVETAVLALIDELTDAGGQQLRALVTEAAWESGDAARGLSEGFLAFFAEHGELLRVADLAALEGDDRFRQLRTRLFNGVFLALQDLAHEARASGAIDASASPGGIASVLTTMLTQVSSHRRGFESWGVSGEELGSTMTAIIDATIRGGAAEA